MSRSPHILEIDIGAIEQNYRLLAGLAPRAGACIKANAYGLGAHAITPALERAGCGDYFVATLDEGIAARALSGNNIYVLGGLHTGDAADFAAHRLIPVLNGLEDIEAYTHGPCAIMLDTGMNRLGLDSLQAAALAQRPELLKACEVKLFLSHFVAAEEIDNPLNAKQISHFKHLHSLLSPIWPQAAWSLANSSGIFHFKDALYDLTRPGYALYGGNPTPAHPNPMQPAISLQARILQTRHAQAGESIGYNATHHINAHTQLAIICIGYGDGFLRSLGERGHVYWRGTPCPVLGRISMDACCVGIGHITRKPPQSGDMVEVIGPNQSLEQLGAAAGTNGYEMLSALGGRYKRRYINTYEQ